MKQFKFRSITCGILGAILLLGTAAPLTFTACENEHPEISITLTSDYSGIIDAINNVNKTLSEKLALIEQGIKDGNLQNQQALDLIQKAIEAMNGTLEQKLDAIKSVIESQTTSLETKLALIEAAIKNGFADNKAGQELIQKALDSLTTGSMEQKMDAIEDAIKSQTTSLEGKLALIEAAIKNGFADNKAGQELIQTALESLSGSLEEKLAAIEDAIESQTTSLESKLALIETALKTGFTDEKTALGEIKTALESIKGSVDGLDSAIDEIVASIDAITDALGDLNETAGAPNTALTGEIATALTNIFNAIDGLTDYSDILEAIKEAIENIEISGDGGDDSGDDGKINGYEYVEMGDGLKWATMNVGATKPEEYGDHFAWGETETKSDFSGGTYKWMQSGQSSSQYITKYTFADGQTDGIWYDDETFKGDNGDGVDHKDLASYDYADDAARQIWKGTWRIPTDAEWTTLRDEDNFKWTWTFDYEGTGIAGMVVTSKVSGYVGNTIFLPAAGFQYGNSPYGAGSYGSYWSSSLYEGFSGRARYVYFNPGGVFRGDDYRYYGFSVRPSQNNRASRAESRVCSSSPEAPPVHCKAITDGKGNSPAVPLTANAVSIKRSNVGRSPDKNGRRPSQYNEGRILIPGCVLHYSSG